MNPLIAVSTLSLHYLLTLRNGARASRAGREVDGRRGESREKKKESEEMWCTGAWVRTGGIVTKCRERRVIGIVDRSKERGSDDLSRIAIRATVYVIISRRGRGEFRIGSFPFVHVRPILRDTNTRIFDTRT